MDTAGVLFPVFQELRWYLWKWIPRPMDDNACWALKWWLAFYNGNLRWWLQNTLKGRIMEWFPSLIPASSPFESSSGVVALGKAEVSGKLLPLETSLGIGVLGLLCVVCWPCPWVTVAYVETTRWFSQTTLWLFILGFFCVFKHKSWVLWCWFEIVGTWRKRITRQSTRSINAAHIILCTCRGLVQFMTV